MGLAGKRWRRDSLGEEGAKPRPRGFGPDGIVVSIVRVLAAVFWTLAVVSGIIRPRLAGR